MRRHYSFPLALVEQIGWIHALLYRMQSNFSSIFFWFLRSFPSSMSNLIGRNLFILFQLLKVYMCVCIREKEGEEKDQNRIQHNNQVIKIFSFLLLRWIHLKRNICMFLLRILQFLAAQQFQILANTLTCGMRFDNIIDETSNSRWEWIGKFVDIFCLFVFHIFARTSAENNLDGTLSSHHSDLNRERTIGDKASSMTIDLLQRSAKHNWYLPEDVSMT